jgi:hypothetical protein
VAGHQQLVQGLHRYAHVAEQGMGEPGLSHVFTSEE